MRVTEWRKWYGGWVAYLVIELPMTLWPTLLTKWGNPSHTYKLVVEAPYRPGPDWQWRWSVRWHMTMLEGGGASSRARAQAAAVRAAKASAKETWF